MNALRTSATIRTHAVMGTMASVHVHDRADPVGIDAAVDALW